MDIAAVSDAKALFIQQMREQLAEIKVQMEMLERLDPHIFEKLEELGE